VSWSVWRKLEGKNPSRTINRVHCEVYGKARFFAKGEGWSSDIACAKVIYIVDRNKLVFVKKWKQQSKVNLQWSEPSFLACEVEHFREVCLHKLAVLRGDEKKAPPRTQRQPLKNHLASHCERCLSGLKCQ